MLISMVSGVVVDKVDNTFTVLMDSGLGIRVSCHEQLIEGEDVRLRIVTATNSQNGETIGYYGYPTFVDVSLHKELTEIQSVSDRLAFNILSVGRETLISMLASGDIAGIKRIKGVGDKVAGNILKKFENRFQGARIPSDVVTRFQGLLKALKITPQADHTKTLSECIAEGFDGENAVTEALKRIAIKRSEVLQQ